MSVLGGVHLAHVHDALLPTPPGLQSLKPLGPKGLRVLVGLAEHDSLWFHPGAHGAGAHSHYNSLHLRLHFLYYASSEAMCRRPGQRVHHCAYGKPGQPRPRYVFRVGVNVLGILVSMYRNQNL